MKTVISIISRCIINKIISNKGIKKYFTNFSWQFGDYIFSLISSFIVGIAVARYLGPESYGIIAFASALLAIAVVIVSLGIDDIIMRDMIDLPKKQGSIQCSALLIKFISAIIVYIIIILYILLNYNGEKLYVTIIITSAVFFQPLSVYSCIFTIKAQAKYTSIARIISYTISSFLKIIFIVFNANIIYFAVATFLDYAFLYILVLLIYKLKKWSLNDWYIDIKYIKNILKKAIPLFLIVLFFSLYQKISVVMISYIYSDYESGLYNAAIRLTEVWFLVPAIMMSAFYPALVDAKKISDDEYNKTIIHIFNITSFPFSFISLVIMILSPFIINILYGSQYVDSGIVLAITILAVPFISFYIISSKYFIIENKIMHLFFRSLLALMTIAILNYVLGMYYSIKGFSLSLLISAFISFFVVDIFFKGTRNLFFIKLYSFFTPFIFLFNRFKNNNIV